MSPRPADDAPDNASDGELEALEQLEAEMQAELAADLGGDDSAAELTAAGNAPAAGQADDFGFRFEGGVFVITPAKNTEGLDFGLVQSAAEVLLEPALSRPERPAVVFDMTKMNYFGSIFFSILLRCQKVVEAEGGQLALANPSPMAREMLTETRLDERFAIFETLEESIAALDPSRPPADGPPAGEPSA